MGGISGSFEWDSRGDKVDRDTVQGEGSEYHILYLWDDGDAENGSTFANQLPFRVCNYGTILAQIEAGKVILEHV
jgi:hypothetical protein